jgi:hypothetical protein
MKNRKILIATSAIVLVLLGIGIVQIAKLDLSPEHRTVKIIVKK